MCLEGTVANIALVVQLVLPIQVVVVLEVVLVVDAVLVVTLAALNVAALATLQMISETVPNTMA